MRIDFLTCQKLFAIAFKRNYFCHSLLILSIITFVISNTIKNNLNQKHIEFDSMQTTSIFADELNKNSEKHKFISEHLFLGTATSDFESFVNKMTTKNNGEIVSYEQDDEIAIKGANGVKKRTANMVCLFWHDAFVFDFINDIDSFRPGFAKIVAVEIERTGEIFLAAPSIRASIKCEIFQK